MKILVGVAIAVISGTIAVVASDHNTIVVHGERLEDVKKLDVAVNDLRQSNTDIKLSVIEIKTEVRSLNKTTGEIKESVKKLESDGARKRPR